MEKPYQQSTIEGGLAFVTPCGFVRLRVALKGRSSLSDEKRNFRLSKSVRPSRYELRFELDLDGWHSTGQARVFLVLDAPAREMTLHAVDLDITSAAIDGDATMRDGAYEPEAQTATLHLAGEVAKRERVLTIQWTGEIREALRGLYRSTSPG